MASLSQPKLVMSPEVRAIINLDPGNIVRCLKSHITAAKPHFTSGKRSDFRTTCRWHDETLFITTVRRGQSFTTRIRFASER